VKKYIDEDPELLEYETADEHSTSPFLLAVTGGRLECVQFLVQRGARVVATNTKSQGAVQLAVQNGCIDLLQYFVDAAFPDVPVWCTLLQCVQKCNRGVGKAADCLKLLTDPHKGQGRGHDLGQGQVEGQKIVQGQVEGQKMGQGQSEGQKIVQGQVEGQKMGQGQSEGQKIGQGQSEGQKMGQGQGEGQGHDQAEGQSEKQTQGQGHVDDQKRESAANPNWVSLQQEGGIGVIVQLLQGSLPSGVQAGMVHALINMVQCAPIAKEMVQKGVISTL
ncbi:hypothetical protein Ahia01_000237000, partial [Argonauta hians]